VDRIGQSSVMISRYRRAARTAAELGLSDLAPLDQAIPELGGAALGGERKGAGKGGEGPAIKKSAPSGSANSSIISISSPARTRTGTPSRAEDFKTGGRSWRRCSGPRRRAEEARPMTHTHAGATQIYLSSSRSACSS
jgi:hypothetical protein